LATLKKRLSSSSSGGGGSCEPRWCYHPNTDNTKVIVHAVDVVVHQTIGKEEVIIKPSMLLLTQLFKNQQHKQTNKQTVSGRSVYFSARL